MPPERFVPTRREFLAVGAATASVALAGCGQIIDGIADQVLEDVNVFNETEQEISGTIAIRTTDDKLLLDDDFSLGPPDDDEHSNLGTFESVWDSAGSYTVELELDSEVEGQSNSSGTVTISDPDDEMLLVPLGGDNIDEPIDFRVGTSFTDTVNE